MGTLLNKFLLTKNKSENTISKALYKELLATENELNKRMNDITKAEQVIKENSINVKSISEATGISRKTFYNNELLNSFVQEHTTVDRDSKEEITKLKDNLKDKNEKINKLLYRDIDFISMQNEISKLQNELEYANSRISALEKQHEEDMTELNKENKKSYKAWSWYLNELSTLPTIFNINLAKICSKLALRWDSFHLTSWYHLTVERKTYIEA